MGISTKFGIKREEMPAQGKNTTKAPRFYAVDRVVKKAKTFKPNPTKLRPSITPGTVLIVLSGKFRGKRVVFLKQLDSGLLLVTGPYKLNGVPLRRMNQAYVIATSTKVDGDVSGVAADVTDDFFKKPKAEEKKEKTIYEARKKTQEAVDAKLVAAVSKDALL